MALFVNNSEPMLPAKRVFKIIGIFLATIAGIYLLLLLTAGLYINHQKHRIIDFITAELTQRLRGKAVIHDIDVSVWSNFPAIDFRLNGFTLSDSVYHQPAIAAQTVSTSFSVLQLIGGKTVINNLLIQNAALRLFTDSAGYTNQYLLSVNKPATDTGKVSSSNNVAIEKVRLKNVLVSIEDKVKEKEISFVVNALTARIAPVDSLMKIQLSENITTKKGLGFNLAKGAFLENQSLEGNWLVSVNPSLRTISFNETMIEISRHPFQISGVFTLDKVAPTFSIRFKTKKVPYLLAKSIVSEHIRKKLDLVTLQEPLDADGTLDGSLLPAREPAININWQTSNNTVLTDAGRFNKCSFTGNFMNTMNPSAGNVDSNSRISFSKLKGEWDGIPFTADSSIITNLDTARLQFHVVSQCRLELLDAKLAMQDIAFKNGIADADLRYNGPIVQNKSVLEGITGTIAIKDGQIDYVPRGFSFTNCTGSIALYHDSIRMDNFTCSYDQNKFDASIITRNFRHNIIGGNTSKVATIECTLHSPFIDLDDFTSLFDKRKQRNKDSKTTGTFAATARMIDDMLDNSVVGVYINADALKHGSLRATKLAASVRFEPEYWELTRIALNIAGGNVVSSGKVIHSNGNQHTAFFKVTADNVDVTKLLFAFDDFGQDAITHDHLNGRFSTLAALQANISDKGTIVPASLKGSLDFKLVNASLENFDAFENLKPFLIKNRDMSTVRFAELKDKILINGQNVFVNRMEIQSSAFRLFLEGNYGLAHKNTDLLIQVPFSNLNKNSFDSVSGPVNKGLQAKTGASLWLRAVNREDGKVKVKLTMSKKVKTAAKNEESN